MNEIKFHYLKNVFQKEVGISITLPEILEKIKANVFAEQINYLRTLNKSDSEYVDIKLQLDAVIFGATCNVTFSNERCTKPTGFIFIDIDEDGMNGYPMEDLKKIIFENYSFVIAVWKSVGGKGIGMIIKADNINSYMDYTNCYHELKTLFENDLGVYVDIQCASMVKKAILSYDAGLLINNYYTSYYHAKSVENEICSEEENKSKHIYFSETKIDIHYKDKIDSPAFMKLEKGVYYAVDGMKCVRKYGRKNKIPVTKRASTLSAELFGMINLNGHWGSEKLFGWLRKRNFELCEEPLPDKEINKMFSSCWKRYNPERVKGKDKYTWFSTDCNYSKEEKISISNRNRSIKTKMKIDEAIEQFTSCGKKFTQKNISDLSGVCLRTVKKYYKVSEGVSQCNILENEDILQWDAPCDTRLKVENGIEILKSEGKKITGKLIAEITGLSIATVKRYYTPNKNNRTLNINNPDDREILIEIIFRAA